MLTRNSHPTCLVVFIKVFDQTPFPTNLPSPWANERQPCNPWTMRYDLCGKSLCTGPSWRQGLMLVLSMTHDPWSNQIHSLHEGFSYRDSDPCCFTCPCNSPGHKLCEIILVGIGIGVLLAFIWSSHDPKSVSFANFPCRSFCEPSTTHKFHNPTHLSPCRPNETILPFPRSNPIILPEKSIGDETFGPIIILF